MIREFHHKKRIILSCVICLLLVVFFIPKNATTYANQTDPDGNIQHYKIPITRLGLDAYMESESSMRVPNFESIFPKIIWERQLLKPYDELTHEERLDTLHTECGKLFQHVRTNCYNDNDPPDVCYRIYAWDHYAYCKKIHDNTRMSMEECSRFHNLYVQFWSTLDDSDEKRFKLPIYFDFDAYAKEYCNIE